MRRLRRPLVALLLLLPAALLSVMASVRLPTASVQTDRAAFIRGRMELADNQCPTINQKLLFLTELLDAKREPQDMAFDADGMDGVTVTDAILLSTEMLGIVERCGDGANPFVCGNGIPEGNEHCDNGTANSNVRPNACRTNCTSPYCGDGIRDDAPPQNEVCDHGNANGQVLRCNMWCTGYVADTEWHLIKEDALPVTGGIGFMGATVHNGKMWIAGGINQFNNNQSGVYSSGDGLSWKRESDLPSYMHDNLLVSFGGKLWSIGGYRYPNTLRTIYASVDGKTWTTEPVQAADPGFRSQASGVIFQNKLWVLGGYVNDLRSLALTIHAFDGTTWEKKGTLPIETVDLTASSKAVVYDGKLYIIGGGDFAKRFSYVSSDGLTWERIHERNWMSYQDDAENVLVFKNRMVKVGAFGGGGSMHVDHSTDGIHWTAATALPFRGVDRGFRAVVFNDKIWVLGGGAEGKGIYRSVYAGDPLADL